MSIGLDHLLRGLVMGFSIAAPVGPIGALCIRRTLTDGRASGFVSGLGAATADAIYGSIAAFGLKAVADGLTSQQTWLRWAGGLFLVYLGVRTLISRPSERTAVAPSGSLAGAYLSTFFLTVTNPMTILSFAGVFAGLGLGGATGRYAAASLMVGGVFAGSALWWLMLSGGVGLFREALVRPGSLIWVNRISGLIIAGFGALALWGGR